MKFKSDWLIKYHFWIMTCLIVAILIILTIFLYKNFYKTLIQAREVQLLRSRVAIEMVNSKLFSEVLGRLQEKRQKNEIDWSKIKNPFKSF